MCHIVACLGKSPINPREAYEMSFILQTSTGTQMMENGSFFESSQPWRGQNTPCNPNLDISCNKSTYQTELRTKVKQSAQLL
jgi:hypothetical protein